MRKSTNKTEHIADKDDNPQSAPDSHDHHENPSPAVNAGENRDEQVDLSQQDPQALEKECPDGSVPSSDESSSEHSAEMMTPDQLHVELTSSRAEVVKLKDGYLRAKAEAENIQRRSQNEITTVRKYAVEGFARELLSVADSLDQASKVEIDESAGDAVERMREGIALTLRQLEAIFDRFDIAAVEAGEGVAFNPDCHQAISMIDSTEFKSGSIVSVMQKGYLLKDRLLRPAMVVIAN